MADAAIGSEETSRGDDAEGRGALGPKMRPWEFSEPIECHDEDVRPFTALKPPCMPTQEEVDRHRITHLPFRSWCPECVEAFGREWAHHRVSTERSIPLVSCDYMYLTANGAFAREDLPEEDRQSAAGRKAQSSS